MVDISGINNGPAFVAPVRVADRKPAVQPQPQLQAQAQVPTVNQEIAELNASKEAQAARFAAVRAAAQLVASNPYPVSDQRFTIYKDVAGDYVTRFTSLVDGSVKYYPEKSLYEIAQVLRARTNLPSFDTEA